MKMNPDTNMFEKLQSTTPDERPDEKVKMAEAIAKFRQELPGSSALVRPNGEAVPNRWTVLTVGQRVVVEGYTFAVAHIGEKHLLLEPVGPVVVDGK
jgi:hypothetical protein